MHKALYKVCFVAVLTLFAALAFSSTPQSVHAASRVTLDTSTGVTSSWANVRSGPGTSNGIIRVDAPGTAVTVFSTVSGQVVWDGIATWDRISNPNIAPEYIYGGLVTLASAAAAPTTNASSSTSAPTSQGKEIVVSLSQQSLTAYENGNQVYSTLVLTGRPDLATPTGTYHVFAKLSPTTFYSPWPTSSPYWYPPTFVNYALEWHDGGYFIHDATWHSQFGPGTNTWHNDPVFGEQNGSHGCINTPLDAAKWLYNWAPIGTTVQVNP